MKNHERRKTHQETLHKSITKIVLEKSYNKNGGLLVHNTFKPNYTNKMNN